jgi:Predicted Zn-dependent peptidases, insulinase-like
MKKVKVRCRCPLCGMLVWQSRLNRDYPFEFVIQEITGGYKQIKNKYRKAFLSDTPGAKAFEFVLAMKMIAKSEQILKKLDSDFKVDLQMPDEMEEELEGIYEDAVDVEEAQDGEVEVEREVVLPSYAHEVEIGGYTYEFELDTVGLEDVRQKSFLGRLFAHGKRKGKPIEEMEALREIEHDLGGIEVSKDYDSNLEIEVGR